MDQITNEIAIETTVEPTMRVLMAGVCPSLSGASEISFLVGCPEGAQDISNTCFQIAGNTSSGRYNAQWVSLEAIERCIAEIPSDQPFPVAAFKPIYAGGSANSHGFLGSILLHIGLIARAPEGQSYVRHTATAFWEEVQGLIGSTASHKPTYIGKSAGHTDVKAARKSAKKAAPAENA